LHGLLGQSRYREQSKKPTKHNREALLAMGQVHKQMGPWIKSIHEAISGPREAYFWHPSLLLHRSA
jgi:hypothetical protein